MTEQDHCIEKQNKKSLANSHLKATVPLQWHFGVCLCVCVYVCVFVFLNLISEYRAVVRDELAADVFNVWV